MVGDGGGGGGGASAPSARAARAALVAWMRAGGFWWDEARLDMDADAAGEDAAARGVAARADIDAPTEEQLRHQARGSDEARQLQERPRVDGEDGSAKDGEDGGAEAQPNPEPTALAVMPLARLLTWRTCWAREMAAAAVDARDADANCSTRSSGSWVMPAAVALLAERAAGERSAWRPYVAALPDGADVPWRWEEADARALLRGTDAHALAEHIRVSARTEWERYVLPAVRKAAARHGANTAATATGPKPQGATHAGARDTRQDRAETEVDAGAGAPLEALYADEALWTLDGYLRCRSLVTSRAFNLPAPDVAGLVPGADLFNHAPVGKHTVSFQEGAAGFRLETDDGIPVECVCVAAHAAAKAGQELFLTYGPLPPAELLCHFAFVDEAPLRAEDTAVCVSLGELRAAAALEGRAALKAEPTGAEQQSSSGASASEYAVHGDGSASNDLRAAAAALCGGDAAATARTLAGAARRRLARLGDEPDYSTTPRLRARAVRRLRVHERAALEALLAGTDAEGAADAAPSAAAAAVASDQAAWDLF